VLFRIDITRQPIALAITFNLDTPIRDGIAERNIVLEINGVPAERDESISIVHLVSASDISRPVTDRLVLGAPYTAFLDANTRGVDIEALNLISNPSSTSGVGILSLLRRGGSPVIRTWY
jgi:hypothetical protein